MELYGKWAGFTLKQADDPRVAILEFDNPEQMNGLSWAVRRDITEAMLQIQYAMDPSVVIFTGGRHFSSGDGIGRGGPLAEWQDARSHSVVKGRNDPISTYDSLRTISQVMQRSVRNLDKLTIAAIDGYTLGSALSIALSCDFRIATPRAKLGGGTLRMAFQPDDGGHWLLVQYLGVAKTKDFLFNKRIVSGEEALRLGLVTELAEPEALMERALKMAVELADGPQVAMRLLKHAIENAYTMTYEQSGQDIAARTAISDHEHDTSEGMRAFRAKEKPKFNTVLHEPMDWVKPKEPS